MVVVILCLEGAGWLRDTHVLRFMALGASTTVLVGMVFDSSRSWYRRLTWMGAALALAGIAAWFMPTLHGVNLWSAYRQIEALRALPAGDMAAYQRGAPARRILVEEFPSFAADVAAAEQAWLRRTVDEAIERADRQLEVDPHGALADLHRLSAELTPLEHYTSVRNELDAARRRALQACVKTAAE
jgi:hypothetical protein